MPSGWMLLQALIAVLICCKSASNPDPGFRRIEFGGGGGVTGRATAYAITSGGDLFKLDGGKEVFIKKIEKVKVRKIGLMAYDLKSYQYQSPGNIYSFIKLTMDVTDNYIAWDPASGSTDRRALDLFSYLNALTK